MNLICLLLGFCYNWFVLYFTPGVIHVNNWRLTTRFQHCKDVWMVRIMSCDGMRINIPLECIYQSMLMRDLLEVGSDARIALIHHCCSYEALLYCFEIADNHQTPRIAIEDFVDIYDMNLCLNIFDASMYLEMNIVLCELAKVPNLLHALCTSGNRDGVRVLIEAKVDIEAKNPDGKTAKELTTDEGCLEELVRGELLSRGYTQLMIEARAGHVSTTRALLFARAELHVQDCAGRTALHLAAGKGHADVVLALLDGGAPPDGRPLIDQGDGHGTTALHAAAAAGHADVVRVLIRSGSDMEVKAGTKVDMRLKHKRKRKTGYTTPAGPSPRPVGSPPPLSSLASSLQPILPSPPAFSSACTPPRPGRGSEDPQI